MPIEPEALAKMLAWTTLPVPEWAIEAADRILDIDDLEMKAENWNKDVMRKRIAAIIVSHVPRCKTCAHWDKDIVEKDQGHCLIMYRSSDAKIWPDYRDGINTTADFGCVQHKEKD